MPKNVQVIDGAINSTFEIYCISDDIFEKLFPEGANIAFAEEFSDEDPMWERFYANPIRKAEVNGIHGTLHLAEKEEKERYFPKRREEEVKG